MSKIYLRRACLEDAQAVLDIYRPYIEETVITFEYEVPSLSDYRERMRGIMEGYPYLVCELDGKIAGYVYAHPYRERKAFQWDAELSVYLDSRYTGRGLGRALYGALLEILKLQNVKKAYALVAVPNPSSEALHKEMGFEREGLSKETGYKLGRWIDLACFVKTIGGMDKAPEPLLAFGQLDRQRVEQILEREADRAGRRAT